MKNSEKKSLAKVAFLDRDGTLICEPQDTYQVDKLEQLQILPGVIEGLRRIQGEGYKLVMVSNQDALGTKSFPRKDLEVVQNAFLKMLHERGISF